MSLGYLYVCFIRGLVMFVFFLYFFTFFSVCCINLNDISYYFLACLFG